VFNDAAANEQPMMHLDDASTRAVPRVVE